MGTELENVTSCLKSILTSHGADMTVKQLSADYVLLVGKEVPYRQFEYPNLISFLKSIPSIMVREQCGGTYLSLAGGAEKGLRTIQRMVIEQNKKSKKHVATRRTRSFDSRGFSHYGGSQNYPLKPSRAPLLPHRNSMSQKVGFMNIKHPNYPHQAVNPPTKSIPNISHQVSSKPSTQPTFGFNKPNSIKVTDQLTFGFNPVAQSVTSNQPTFGFNKPSDKVTSKKQASFGDNNMNLQNKSSEFIHGFNKLSTKSGNAISPQPMLPTLKPQPLLPTPALQPSSQTKKSDGVDKQVDTSKKKLELEREAQRMFPNEKPMFTTMTWGKKNRNWLATVKIGKMLWSSYPEEIKTAELAEECVSKIALTELKEHLHALLPVTSNPDDYVDRIKQLIANSGRETIPMVETQVEELYQEYYKEGLPEGWVKEVEKRAEGVGLMLKMPYENCYTLCMAVDPSTSIPPHENGEQKSNVSSALSRTNYTASNKDSQRNTTSNKGNEETSGGKSKENRRFPTLTLPSSPYWDVFVMYIEDLSHIFLRLVGDKYSAAYDDLLTDLELHYMEEKNHCPVESPVIGEIYAANWDESWFRVKLIQIQDQEVTVYFVDHGDTEVLQLANLHHLKETFFSLAAQCICCRLFGLEHSSTNSSALTLLQTMALGQTLVGEVKTEIKDINVEKGSEQPIPLILYDTSGKDDININEKIMEHIVDHFPEPALPPVGGIAEVYLMHISTSGDIFVQVESNTYHTLFSLLLHARSHTEMLGVDAEIDMKRLYLARFSQDGEWYRAAPRGKPDPNGKVEMLFVDFGNCDLVPITDVRPLATHGQQLRLTKIPYQALKCQLHKVPGTPGLKWTQRACQRLVHLSPEDTPLLLKVQEAESNGVPPQVELFKRIQPQNELVSLNATLSLDTALFRDEDSNNNNNLEDAVHSPKQSVSRQLSSASQSSSSQGFVSGPSSLNSSPGSLPSSPRPSDSQALTLPSQVVPKVGDYYDIIVTYAANPSNFAVQSLKMSVQLTQLMEEMAVYYGNCGSSPALDKVSVGSYYAVQHTDDVWYRAYVNMVQEDIVTGSFVDYGDCFVTSTDRVRALKPSFCKLSCQALKAKLHDIQPVNKDWTIDDTSWFQKLVEHHAFVSAVMGLEQGEAGTTCLSLILIDTGDKDLDVYINQILVDEGRAVKIMGK